MVWDFPNTSKREFKRLRSLASPTPEIRLSRDFTDSTGFVKHRDDHGISGMVENKADVIPYMLKRAPTTTGFSGRVCAHGVPGNNRSIKLISSRKRDFCNITRRPRIFGIFGNRRESMGAHIDPVD